MGSISFWVQFHAYQKELVRIKIKFHFLQEGEFEGKREKFIKGKKQRELYKQKETEKEESQIFLDLVLAKSES